MIAFLRIEEQINSIFKIFIEEHNFQISITDFEIEMSNNVCKILIKTDRYYPELTTFLGNYISNSRNKYELGNVMRLRKIPFMNLSLDSGVNSDDDCRIERLEKTEEILKKYCQDVIQGNFSNLDAEGYWEMPKLTYADVEFIRKYGRYPE